MSDTNTASSTQGQLTLATVKCAVIKATAQKIELNSKKEKTVWLRLDDAIKGNADYIVTSKNNAEFAAKLPSLDIESGIKWLADNQGLENVRQWFEAKLIEVNRPIIATAGASGLNECDLIADIQSLIAFDTLESARGRKASSLNAEQWKAYQPILALCLEKFFTDKKVDAGKLAQLVGKYVHLIKGAVYHFSPVGDDSTMDKVQEMIDLTCEYVIEQKPELESVAAFAVQVCMSNREKYTIEGADEY
jgi:hypothetical protein